ncbi:hypothetical protein DRE43_24140 [Salmonella enterica subsp. enterica serovar Java]|uniref:Fimbrial protein n=1 Tax=Salmonella enterica TaxID=28901 RepID=A0A5V3WIE2_SALER|nr:hypothetical protein [Salmonella enterica]EBS2909204.1 hypothetical protein [Salmonella enterica subsp. enterica serovar Flottbek]EBX2067693.1 hypothetical protein [Salmonella enterica subsp. enterica serovar Java]EDD5836684.1 hypothetical protein [Salmonella enterica subsp. enterica serovar Enteritidis]EDQ0314688.1 hypothetical protein [Salmonella enterica subsp. enterica serovar Berta]EDR6294162.1 hypothetical protein [Salmonella enterica subsp. enterica serovar Pensacola]
MKTPAFTVTGVMACLMLLSQPVNAQTEARATFNLQAKLKEPTCNQALTSSGDADGGGNVDFGTFSLADGGSVEKTKHVVLTLTCDSASPPMAAGIGFKVIKGQINTSVTGRVNPEMAKVGVVANFGYDWAWGKNINEAVADKPYGGYDTLKPGEKVRLQYQVPISYYFLVQKEGKVTWDFPVDITLKDDFTKYAAGDYIAAVQVNISYE